MKIISMTDQENASCACSPKAYHAQPYSRSGRRRHERGSAVLVVFILVTLMVAITIANAKALHVLQQEIRLIEKRQLRKFAVQPSAVNTNRVPAITTMPENAQRAVHVP
jgi:hypothetical protein